jgi:hypothetical protein
MAWTSGWRASHDGGAHLVRLVADDPAPGDLVSLGEQEVEDGAAAGVGRLGARVADRQDVAVHDGRRRGLVIEVAHGSIIQGRREA